MPLVFGFVTDVAGSRCGCRFPAGMPLVEDGGRAAEPTDGSGAGAPGSRSVGAADSQTAQMPLWLRSFAL